MQLLAQGFSIYGPRARVQSALTTMEYVLSIERVQSMNRIFYEIEEASCQLELGSLGHLVALDSLLDQEMEVPHGSTRGSTVCRDSTEGSREEEGILDGPTLGESRKLSDSGISSEEMGHDHEEENGKGGEGGWSWIVVLAG